MAFSIAWKRIKHFIIGANNLSYGNAILIAFRITWKRIRHLSIGSNIPIKVNAILFDYRIKWKRITHFIIGSNIMGKENITLGHNSLLIPHFISYYNMLTGTRNTIFTHTPRNLLFINHLRVWIMPTSRRMAHCTFPS